MLIVASDRYGLRMFDPRRLVVLEAIAEHRSFTKAAEALFTSQPAVSRQIAALERELAASLVVRDARSVVLTAAGEALLEHARTLLPAIDAAAREVAAHGAPDGGSVRLGAVPSAITSFIPAAIEALRADRPRVRVRIDEGWGEDLVVQTSRGTLDLAVVSAACRTRLSPANRADQRRLRRLAARRPPPRGLAPSCSWPTCATSRGSSLRLRADASRSPRHARLPGSPRESPRPRAGARPSA